MKIIDERETTDAGIEHFLFIIAGAFILGILAGKLFSLPFWVVFASAITLSFSCLLFLKHRRVFFNLVSLSFFAIGLVTLVVAGVVLAVVGTVFTIAFALIPLVIKVGIVMLVGWGVLKVLDGRNAGRLSAADRQWLEKGD